MAYSSPHDPASRNQIRVSKLPRGLGLKFASKRANQVDCSFNYFGKWTLLVSHAKTVEHLVEPAVRWLHENAKGEWQYRLEQNLRYVAELKVPTSTYYERHFIRFELKDDAMRFKLTGL